LGLGAAATISASKADYHCSTLSFAVQSAYTLVQQCVQLLALCPAKLSARALRQILCDFFNAVPVEIEVGSGANAITILKEICKPDVSPLQEQMGFGHAHTFV
jgi:hypothetical protein